MFSLRTGALLVALGSIGAQAPPTPAPYTVLSAEGRRPLATRLISGQEMFALDDLTKLFELTVREDTLAGGLTVTARTQSIVLTPGQSLASVGGRLISLPAPPARDGRSWFVPVDFVPRALAAAMGTPLELRKPSRLILVGNVRVPRVGGNIEVIGPITRLTLDVAPPTPHSIAQEGTRLTIKFEADALDAALPTPSAPDLMHNHPAGRRREPRHRPRSAVWIVPVVGSAWRSRRRPHRHRPHRVDDRASSDCRSTANGSGDCPAAGPRPPPFRWHPDDRCRRRPRRHRRWRAWARRHA